MRSAVYHVVCKKQRHVGTADEATGAWKLLATHFHLVLWPRTHAIEKLRIDYVL
jgi:hypothetical protein